MSLRDKKKIVVVGTNEAALEAARNLVSHGYSLLVFEPLMCGHLPLGEDFLPRSESDKHAAQAAEQAFCELGADLRVLSEPSEVAIMLTHPDALLWCIENAPSWIGERISNSLILESFSGEAGVKAARELANLLSS